jgi:hypothetical protein
VQAKNVSVRSLYFEKAKQISQRTYSFTTKPTSKLNEIGCVFAHHMTFVDNYSESWMV